MPFQFFKNKPLLKKTESQSNLMELETSTAIEDPLKRVPAQIQKITQEHLTVIKKRFHGRKIFVYIIATPGAFFYALLFYSDGHKFFSDLINSRAAIPGGLNGFITHFPLFLFSNVDEISLLLSQKPNCTKKNIAPHAVQLGSAIVGTGTMALIAADAFKNFPHGAFPTPLVYIAAALVTESGIFLNIGGQRFLLNHIYSSLPARLQRFFAPYAPPPPSAAPIHRTALLNQIILRFPEKYREAISKHIDLLATQQTRIPVNIPRPITGTWIVLGLTFLFHNFLASFDWVREGIPRENLIAEVFVDIFAGLFGLLTNFSHFAVSTATLITVQKLFADMLFAQKILKDLPGEHPVRIALKSFIAVIALIFSYTSSGTTGELAKQYVGKLFGEDNWFTQFLTFQTPESVAIVLVVPIMTVCAKAFDTVTCASGEPLSRIKVVENNTKSYIALLDLAQRISMASDDIILNENEALKAKFEMIPEIILTDEMEEELATQLSCMKRCC